MASYSAQEKQYYDQLFSIIDTDGTGILPGQDAYPFLTSSNLPTSQLGEVWALADKENNGFLTKEGWYKAARLIGWLQKGGKTVVEDNLLQSAGPYPTFDKGPPPPTPIAPLSAQGTGQQRQQNPLPIPLSANNTGAGAATLPPLNSADRAKFTRLFAGCGPSNGLISGDKARDVFLKSNLGYDKLGQIWNLADTQGRGSLDLTDFVIGMYLIQTAMANPNFTPPATLPPGTYESASGGRAQPPNIMTASSPIARQHTGGAIPSPIRAQYTGGLGGGGILQPQRTGQSVTGQGPATPPRPSAATKTYTPPTSSTFSTLPSTSSFGGPQTQRQNSAFLPQQQQQQQQQQWDVNPQAKATSDQFFSTLDTQGRGVIEGDVAVPFMLQSQLDENTLASIWDLADIRKEGKLTRDEFAVAMHLITAKLAGQDVPSSLPNSLVPPSLRAEYGQGAQEVLSQGPSSAAKDLFDVFGDDEAISSPVVPSQPQQQQQQQPKPFQPSVFLPQPPPPPARRQASVQKAVSPNPTGQHSGGFGMVPFAPQPRNDLLGDDSADSPSAVPDHSAEIGNKQNQLNNTTRGLSELEKTRADLEKNAASSAAQLEELESKLSAARAKHESETKTVADLRIRVAEQSTKLKQLQGDFIAAESDVSALRSEKDELEQALLHDKEEVRGLHKQMKEVEDEKQGLKLVLDKLKKEARQQKGMLSIAKKQLSTAEGSRDSVQQEIEDVKNTPIAIEEPSPAPASAQARTTTAPFSPNALGTASGIPLPTTPQVLSPTATGTSTRSNNPFERLVGARASQPQSRAASSPPPSNEGFGAGAFAAVTAAAGAVVAGAESLFDSAKEVVTGEHDSPSTGTETGSKDLDPFGAPTTEEKTPKPELHESDPFGMPTGPSSTTDAFGAPASIVNAETDPFGAPTTPQQAQGGFNDFDTGFGDSFTNTNESATTKPTEKMHLAPASESNPPSASAPATDFDSAFADFDTNNTEEETDLPNEGIPVGLPKSAIPSDLLARPEAERTLSTQAVAPSSPPKTSGVLTPATPASIRSASPSGSAKFPSSGLAKEIEPEQEQEQGYEHQRDAGESSDEEEGPEDLESPKMNYIGKGKGKAIDEPITDTITPPAAVFSSPAPAPISGLGTSLAPPLPTNITSTTGPIAEDISSPKVRRSAPPPPAASVVPKTSIPSADEFDPFGAPAPTPAAALLLPPGAAPASATTVTPKTANFDEDDFDFSDLPPAQVEHSQTQGQIQTQAHGQGQGGFDDEFASFDDEFDMANDNEHHSGGTSSSYEIVSPQQQQHQQYQQQQQQTNVQTQAQGQGGYDEWGFGRQQASAPALAPAAAPSSGFSFDDAFGGDFEPSPSSNTQQQQQQYAPPPGLPPSKTIPAQTQTQTESGSGASALNPPPIPERRPSTAQPDDIEDVKKLCAMGFSRSLVIDALDANGYDLQKTLNVLLSA